ncbi:MAG: FAD-dependent oxidoreductase [Ktedonobacteraceae bacterium]|nr:FAD-dependent oxidoreductase [Ktedonobacteraceae bacterium]
MSRQATVPIPPYTRIGRPHLDSANIVIIGNGIAGVTAALEARRYAPNTRIVIITEQIHPTINTPALKQFVLGKLERDQLLAYPAGKERAERIHVVTARVEYIHAQQKFVELDGGRGFGYEELLIATGSTPRGFPSHLPGRNFDGVLTLHRLQDYLDLRRRLHELREAAVVGGGPHAIETVMALLQRGIHVHWLIRSATFMPHVLDQHASETVIARVRRAGGASVYMETEAVGIMGRVGMVAGIVTKQKQLLPCQLVLTCTGTQPACVLAEHCDTPLHCEHGILVDDQLRTSIPNIYAAGDVAALQNPQTGTYETRPQWYAAVLQGRIAGAMMAGREATESFGVQWHATQLGELSMLTVGNPLATGNDVTELVDTSQGGYRRMTLVDNRLIGYLSLGATQPDSLAIKRIIDEGLAVRDVTKALLKGNFDARKYLSQLRSRAAHSILMPQKGHVAVPNPPSQVRLLPVTGPLGATPSLTQEQAHYTEPLPARVQVSAYVNLDEEMSPFTGNLPTLSKPSASGGVPRSPSKRRSAPRNLWSYSNKMPTVAPERNTKEEVLDV